MASIEFDNPAKNRNISRTNIYWCVGSSLVIHIVVAALFVLALPDSFQLSSGLRKQKLVFVSLEARSNAGKAVSSAGHSEYLLSAAGPAQPRKAKPEIPETKQVHSAKITAEAGSGQIIPANYGNAVYASSKDQTFSSPSDQGRLSQTEESDAAGVLSANPLYRKNTPPVYPEIARIRGYEGVVLVSTEILPDGTVGNLKIKKSSGYTILDQATIEAVKQWKFEPAKKMGMPYATWRDHLFKFFLNDENSES